MDREKDSQGKRGIRRGPKKRFKGNFWERLMGLSTYDKYDRECECQKVYKKFKEHFFS